LRETKKKDERGGRRGKNIEEEGSIKYYHDEYKF
jgi:hypothetical protein